MQTLQLYRFTALQSLGIDLVDQLCWLYSSKAGSRRLLMHVFRYTLDIAVIRSRTIYEMAGNSAISRNIFLLLRRAVGGEPYGIVVYLEPFSASSADEAS